MSSHPVPRRSALRPSFVLDPYFDAEPQAGFKVRLRPLTPLEEMYAYWGSDREPVVPTN